MSDGFEEVSIDDKGSSVNETPVNSSLGYLSRKNASVQHVYLNDPRSAHTLLDHHSFGSSFFLRESRNDTSPGKEPQIVKPSYSPSKKLREKRGLKKEDLESLSSTFDNSDDELSSSAIIFDVPLSQSLIELTSTHKIQQSSLTSQSTKRSSLMSYDHHRDSTDPFSMEAEKLAMEFCQSKAVRTIQEFELRKHTIVEMEKPITESDFPISRYKESLMTPTRPNHLPPKSPKESMKHLREVKELQSRALKNELKHGNKILKELKQRRKVQEADQLVWEKKIIPNFAQMIQLSSVRELWWRGIPPKYRKFVWIRLISKELDPAYFQSLRSQAKESIEQDTDTVKRINSDILRTFTHLELFQTSLSNQLLEVLAIYSHHSHYEPSLAPIAAIILINFKNTQQTVSTLVGLLQRPLLRSVFSETQLSQSDIIESGIQSFLRTFAQKNTSLYVHIHEIMKVDPRDYLLPLLKSLFTGILTPELVAYIIDIYAFEGDAFLWRCILGLFDKIGYKLYGNREEILEVIGGGLLQKLQQGNQYLEVGDEFDFITTVRQILKKTEK